MLRGPCRKSRFVVWFALVLCLCLAPQGRQSSTFIPAPRQGEPDLRSLCGTPIKVRAQCIFVPCTAGEDDAIVAVKQQQAVPSQWEQWVGSVVGWFTNVLRVGGPKDEIVLSLEEFTQLRDHLLRMQGYIKEAEDRAEQAEALLELFRRHGSEARHVAEAVQLIQRIGEGLAWAYGQPHREIGEEFAQPFVDRRIRDRLRDLLFTQHPHLQAQVLQTIHILLAATPAESLFFCNLTAGFYLNEVENLMLFFNPYSDKPFPFFSQSAKYYHHPSAQVRTHVQATSLEIFSKLKHVLMSGITENLKIADSWSNSLFELVVADSKILFTHVCCLLRDFWRMADETIRSTIWRDMKNAFSLQNDILEYINDVFASDVNQLSAILQDSTGSKGWLGNWRFLVLEAWTKSFAAVHAVWSPVLSQLERTPQDLSLRWAQLTALSEERLLRFAVLPVLLGSALQAQQQPLLTQEASWYLLGDLLATLRSHHVRTVLATTLLRPHVTEEILQLVVSPPPNTPAAYFHLQRSWGGTPQQSYFDTQESAADHQTLYEPVPIPVVAPGESSGKPLHRNSLLEALELRLRCLAFNPGRDGARGVACSVLASSGCLAAFVGQLGFWIAPTLASRFGRQGVHWKLQKEQPEHANSKAATTFSAPFTFHQAPVVPVSKGELCRSGRTQEAVCAFSTLEMSLQALRSAGEPLDLSVAERLGNCLASCLARSPAQHVRQALSPMLRDKLLAPFADELLHEAKLQCLDIQAQGSWLQDFQQQWQTSAQDTGPRARSLYPRDGQDLSSLSEKPRSQILPEPGAAPEASAALPARAKSSGNLWRLLLSLHRLVAGKGTMEMPGLEEGERDELLRYQPGVAVLVGKMNRVKCTENLYLMPSAHTLLLARPDTLKALNAEPVIAEPLRLVVLHTGDENAKAPGSFWGNTEEPSLRMKVFAPRSPALRKLAGLRGAKQHSGGYPRKKMQLLVKYVGETEKERDALKKERDALKKELEEKEALLRKYKQAAESFKEVLLDEEVQVTPTTKVEPEEELDEFSRIIFENFAEERKQKDEFGLISPSYMTLEDSHS
eukprot:s4228_g3.t1